MIKIVNMKIAKDIVLLQLQDDETKYFEALWEIPEGVTYNSYVIIGDGDVIVIDGWKIGFGDVFVDEVKRVVDLKSIKAVVVHHMEPDHSGSLKTLLSNLSSDTRVFGHQLVKDMLQSFYGIKPNFVPVTDGMKANVAGKTLRFFHTPWLHWPDTIVSILDGKVLFSCDIFGSYGIPSALFFEDLSPSDQEKFIWYAKKYFANIIGKYVSWVLKGLEKLSSIGLDSIEIVAPAHGPLRRNVKTMATLYNRWARGDAEKGKVVVLYMSMYGFIEKAIRILIDELQKAGAKIKIHRFVDKYRSSISDMLGDLIDAESFVIATPTYDADVFPFAMLLLNVIISKIPKNKKVLIVSNFGWGPVAGKKIAEMLKTAGFTIVDVVEFRGGNVEDVLPRLREGAVKLLQST
jgi:flavorubredoxin